MELATRLRTKQLLLTCHIITLQNNQNEVLSSYCAFSSSVINQHNQFFSLCALGNDNTMDEWLNQQAFHSPCSGLTIDRTHSPFNCVSLVRSLYAQGRRMWVLANQRRISHPWAQRSHCTIDHNLIGTPLGTLSCTRIMQRISVDRSGYNDRTNNTFKCSLGKSCS